MLNDMEWTRIPLVLVLCWIVPVTAHVLPPTNVTLQCHNFRNVLYWNYSQTAPQLRFRVFVGAVSSTYDPVWVDPSNLSADLSFLRDPKDDYYLSVSALIGENKSVSAPPGGIKFSYFKNSPSNRTCFVDLPPVNVTVHPGGIKFSFQHPSLFYDQPLPTTPTKQRRRQKKQHSAQIKALAEFTYHVATDPKKEHQPHHFSCMESVCEEELPLEEEQERHCLRINGQWEGVAVRATQEYCNQAQASSTNYIYLYIMLPLLICGVIGLIFFMVFQKQTKGFFPLPASMKFPEQMRGKIMGKASLTPEQLNVSQVQASSPTGTPLLSSDIGEESVQGETSVDDVLRLPIGVLNQAGSTSGGTGESSEEVEGSGYMSGRGLDGDTEEREINENYGNSSGYEKRSRLGETVVELVPGEMVKGYQG